MPTPTSSSIHDNGAAGSELRSPIEGTVVAVAAPVGSVVVGGGAVVILESMKMEHPVTVDRASMVTDLFVSVGDQVTPGQVLAVVEPAEMAMTEGSEVDQHELDEIRPDLAELFERVRLTRDDARPEAVAKRHGYGHMMAREWLDHLLDSDSFVEYGTFPVAAQRSRRDLDDLIANTPADGLITGLGLIDGHQVAVLAYDYTVLAGTQGFFNHRKTDRLLSVARDKAIPVIVFAEGGGGRPGDIDAGAVVAAGLNVSTFTMMGSLSGVVPTIGIATGRCFAGNAALLGCCDVVIATRDSNIGMAGPAMIEGGGLGRYHPTEIGPVEVQSTNGVIDIVAEDDAAAIETAREYLGRVVRTRSSADTVARTGSTPTLPESDSANGNSWSAADQRLLRHAIGENRKEVYDPRALITTLVDTGSFMELRAGFGVGIITALVHIEGRSMGLVANDPTHLGGAIDTDGADKMARFLQLCDSYRLPIVSLCDTPGFMVGPESEEAAAVRHFSRLFIIGAHLRVPLVTIILRKGYGLGAQAMAGGSFARPVATVAWPTGEIGGMGLEGAVRLGFAKELGAITDDAEREAAFDALVAAHYETGKAINGAMKHEFDEVIDPADTRRWITATVGHVSTDTRSAGRYIDAW